MPKITPFLWFNENAEEAMNFYTSVFKTGKVTSLNRHGDKVMGGSFAIDGQEFMVLNGGPHFSFTPAISLFVKCKDQAEVDYYWSRLVDGGEESQCGWLKDRFGLSWQIIPDALPELLGDKDPQRANRAVQTMLKMRKIDVAELRRAADGP
jgi:predicted 3-demethylubiquinone-9 3-methyltransferase (glyoxalase superfamily)